MAKQITNFQFRSFPHATRPDGFDLIVEEHEWYSDDCDCVLGVLFKDLIDDDWAYAVFQLAPDGVFRCESTGQSFADMWTARQQLMTEVDLLATQIRTAKSAKAPVNLARKNASTDPFVPVVPEEKLNPLFKMIATDAFHAPARGMIREIFGSFVDYDGNFVEQLQTTGFDSRIWELYLYAYLTDAHFQIVPSVSPDFVVKKFGLSVAVEAVTANATQGTAASWDPYTSVRLHAPPFDSPLPKLDEEFVYKEKDFVPIRLGSALYSKLKKRYWEVVTEPDTPIVLAIEAFHDEASLHYSSSALATYLYGYEMSYVWDASGQLVIVPVKIDSHSFAGKTIPSGFFDQPDAEHISAVLFGNSGTISKFNRMGQQGQYRDDNIAMVRMGLCYDADRNSVEPLEFRYYVGDPKFPEWWGQGLEMLHNPNSLHPVDRDLFPDIVHHSFEDGRVHTDVHPFQPYTSITITGVRASE